MARQGQPAKAAESKRNGGGSTRLIVTAVLLLPVVAVLLPTCMVLLIYMAPTLVAYLIDRSREKYLAITVGLLNFCGMLPAQAELWRHGQSYDAAMDIAIDPILWLIAYGAAAVGWVVYLILPPILANYYGITTDARIRSLRRRQQLLVETWGEEVAGEAQETPPR